MKFGRIASAAAAVVMAASMSAVWASAASLTSGDSNVNGEGFYVLKNDKADDGIFEVAGLDPTSVYGFTITVSGTSDMNGGCGLNSESTGWKQFSWNASSGDAGLKVTKGDDATTITYTSKSPCFKESDTYCQIWLQAWWGDVTIKSIVPLDKDGKEISTGAAPTAETEAPKAEEKTEETAAETASETAADLIAETTVAEETADEEVFDEETLDDDSAAADFDITSITLDSLQDMDLLSLPEEDILKYAVAAYCNTYGTYLGSGQSSNWGQAVKLLTYNNIGEDEEPGDDQFDSDLINPSNAVIVLYESETAPELILQSWSGGEGWAKVPVNEEESIPGIALFTYDYMAAMYQSEDMSTLDAIYVGDTGNDLTVYAAYLVNMDELENFNGVMGDTSLDFDEEEDFESYFEEEEEPEEEETVEETAPVEEAAEPAPAAPSDSDSAPVNTGNMSAAAIAGIMAAAAGAVAVLRKRK